MNEEKNLRLTVASSPHVASPIDTQNLMRDVLIALVPAMALLYLGCGALVLWLGVPPMILLNGICFLLSALSELFIRIPTAQRLRWLYKASSVSGTWV